MSGPHRSPTRPVSSTSSYPPEQQLGLRYDFTRSVTVGEKNEQGSLTTGPSRGASAGNVDFGAIYRSPYSIGVTLDLLATSNKARTLSSPNLSALDGQPATAFIGNQVKYVIAVQQTHRVRRFRRKPRRSVSRSA